MADDVHRSFIAECREKIEDLPEAELADLRGEAAAARERADAAGDPLEVVPLYDGLLADMDGFLEEYALERTLAKLDASGLEAILAKGDPALRMRALQGVAERALAEAEPVIHRHLASEQDRFVLATAAKVLGGVGGDASVPVLRRFVRHEDPRVRANAVEGLCGLGAPAEELLRCAEDVDHRVRANVAFGLLETRPDEARRLLRTLLQDPTEAARRAAVEVLEKIEPARFLEAYLDALDVAPPDATGTLLRAASRCPDPRVIRFVLDVIEDPERPLSLRSQAMQVCNDLADLTDEELYQDALRDAARAFLRKLSQDDAPAPAPPRAPERAAPEPEPEAAGGVVSSRERKSGADQMRERVKKWITVIGKVTDSIDRKPVRLATVRVASTGMIEYTDRKGQFSMNRLERGETYVFVVDKQGYPTRSVRYRCSGKKEQILRIILVGKRG